MASAYGQYKAGAGIWGVRFCDWSRDVEAGQPEIWINPVNWPQRSYAIYWVLEGLTQRLNQFGSFMNDATFKISLPGQQISLAWGHLYASTDPTKCQPAPTFPDVIVQPALRASQVLDRHDVFLAAAKAFKRAVVEGHFTDMTQSWGFVAGDVQFLLGRAPYQKGLRMTWREASSATMAVLESMRIEGGDSGIFKECRAIVMRHGREIGIAEVVLRGGQSASALVD